MHLVTFDLDGTLTLTNGIDNKCFFRAITEVFGLEEFDRDWTHYKHATDRGCAEELLTKYLGRSVNQDEISSLLRRHIFLLREEANEDPGNFQPVPGVHDMFEDIKGRRDVAVSIATGTCFESAKLKLATAGIDIDGVPLATSSDAIARENIIRKAEARASQKYGIESFDTRTYVGDGLWDLSASRALGYGFVGVTSGEYASLLRQTDAKWLVPDYTDKTNFFSILQMIWNDQSGDEENS